MTNVFPTLVHIDCVPELLNTGYKLGLAGWFNLPPDELLQLILKVFNWVQVRRFRGCFPPIDPVCFKKVLCRP